MAFRINTNVSAMNALVNATGTQAAMSTSLQRLSSGLRINSAADDASGLVIADNLQSQQAGLGQAVKNSNDAIGILQTADNAIATQVKITDTIRVKANQAAQDGQSTQSRVALQNDITKLMSELDNVANTTTYNGVQLLDGSFTNKQFQVGAESNQTISVSINNTNSVTIGSTSFQTSQTISASGTMALKFLNSDNSTTSIAGIKISMSAGTGLGQLANAINAVTQQTGVRASVTVVSTGSAAVGSGTVSDLVLNGVSIGKIENIKANDSTGVLVNGINQFSSQTGVTATVDSQGRLSLTSADGRGIVMSNSSNNSVTGLSTKMDTNFGRLTLTTNGSTSVRISSGSTTGTSTALQSVNFAAAQYTAGLNKVAGSFSAGAMLAAGGFTNTTMSGAASSFGFSGVTTMTGAQMTITIAQNALNQLDSIRSGIGSAVNQITATLSNISVTQVNVAAAQSQIRDTDFASESSSFSKLNILSQSGTYALSQANSMQQSVMKLLQ